MRQLPIEAAILVLNDLPALLGDAYESEPFNITDKNLEEIEALLERPFQVFNGKELYESTAEKIAVLFYQIIKGHKLENGNKRTAVILTLAFLLFNDYRITVSQKKLYGIALLVAKSEASDKDKIIRMLIKEFDKHTKKVKLRLPIN